MSSSKKSNEFIEFRNLGLRTFDELQLKIEKGVIICPIPYTWKFFYDQFVQQDDTKKVLRPLILSSWPWTTDEEKNDRFREQLAAIKERSVKLGVRPQTSQQNIFNFFKNLEGQSSEMLVSQSVSRNLS